MSSLTGCADGSSVAGAIYAIYRSAEAGLRASPAAAAKLLAFASISLVRFESGWISSIFVLFERGEGQLFVPFWVTVFIHFKLLNESSTDIELKLKEAKVARIEYDLIEAMQS